MITHDDLDAINLDFSRRRLLAAAGIGGAAVVAASYARTADAEVALSLGQPADPVRIFIFVE